MKKRLLSLILALVLAVGMLPAAALAAGTGNAEDCAANLGTDASYTGEVVRLSSALYTFTGSSGNWTIESTSNPGVYLHHIASDYAGYPGASTSIAYTLETGGESGSFYLRSVSKDGYGYSYLYFWRNGNNYFDRVTNVDSSACSFRIYKPVSEGETQSSEIPGYVQVTSESAIVSGGQYLIVAAYNGSYYALYPSTSTDSKYAHVVKVNAAAELPAAPPTPSEPDVPDEDLPDLTSDVSSNNWTITVEKYDADGNGTYLLEPTVVDYYYFKDWVPGILNYYWDGNYSKVHYDSQRNEYYITEIVDETQEDGWLTNGELGESSHWKIVWNGTVLADKPSGCYASRGAVIRYIFSANGDAAEAGVNKDALIQLLVNLTDAGKTAAGDAYANANAVVLNPNATAEDVANAIQAIEAALYPAATGISLYPESLDNLGVGKSVTVTATLTPSTSRDTVTWSTADETIATVDQYGVVTGVALGTTTLTAKTSDAVFATISVTVNRVEATGITLSDAQVEVGKTVQLTATIEPENATDSVTWSVTDQDIASISETGLVTGLKVGATTVTARVNGHSAAANLTVVESTDPYVYFEYADGTTQEMAEDNSFTLSSLDEGYFRVANTDATPWWENEEVIDAGQGSVTYHWYVNRETGAWQPSGQQPTKPITVTVGDFTQTFTINYVATSGVTALKTYVNGTEVSTDAPYEVTGCISNVAVDTKGLIDGKWIDIPVQALAYDTSDNVYYNFRFVGNCLEINRAGNATMTVSLKGESVSTTFKVVCNPVMATAMNVIVPETFEIAEWDAVPNQYVGIRPFSEGGYDIEFTPANATNRDVTWTSLTPEIAEHFTTHSAGIVPKQAGTAEFTVTNTADPTLTQKVTVTFVYKNPLTAASTEKAAYTMTAGDTQPLTVNVTPGNATEQRFTWTYDTDGIVEVKDKIESGEGGTVSWTTHSITALKSGTVTVTGTPYDTTGGTGNITFTVTVTSSGASVTPSVSADWPSFRGNDANNGVTSAETPRTAEETELKWAVNYSTGYTDTPSPMIIADNSLISMYGSSLKKLSLTDGTVLASADMAAATSYGTVPPTYGDGVIFCPLNGGTVQAFDAETLESLWVYTDTDGGQSQSPVTYADGKVYVGFYNYGSGAFVCLDAESGEIVWRAEEPSDFYWAGAAVVGDYVVYGNENGHLFSRNKDTGELVTDLTVDESSKIRSTVCYDGGKVYFTLYNAVLCRADLNADTGELTNLTTLDCSAYGTACTSTPTVYDGIVYFGVGGWSGGSSIVAVDAHAMEVKWNVDEPAYPQCSVLLSTAYADTGYVYLYVTYNNYPGGVNVIKAKTDGSGATQEILFEPAADAQQYCICSVIAGSDGTLYYKNDSGFVLAISPKNSVEDSGGGSTTGGGFTGGSTGGGSGTVTVTFQLIGSALAEQPVDLQVSDYLPGYVTWIPTTAYTVNEGSTVYDVFVKALDQAGLAQEGASANYVKSITAPQSLGGYQLSELTNGKYSGWMYTVNGEHPNVGLLNQTLADGDEIVWHYVNDYRYEVDDWADDSGSGSEPAEPAEPAVSETANGELPFIDVAGHWALDAVRYVYEHDLMNGVGGNRFDPDGTLNRAMLAVILYRMEGEPAVTAASPFTDVAAGTWYTDAVIWASENGIVLGYGSGSFGPLDNITREQMAAMLMRYAQYKGYDVSRSNDLSAYTDADEISSWALESLQWANAEGLITGRTDTAIVPGGNTTRAEAAAILTRFLEGGAE